MPISFDNRVFASVANSASGEVGASTRFHYRQTGDLVWATYEGGAVRFGTLIAHADAEGNLEMRYQHVNSSGGFRSGRCHSRLEVLPDGRYRLHEAWTWEEPVDGESGTSVIEEVLPGRSGRAE